MPLLFPNSRATTVVYSQNAVLSTLTGEIEDVIVNNGETATFVCNILTYDTDYNIVWRIDNVTYDCGDGIHCSKSHSVLQVNDTDSLETGSYSVECVLQHMISSNFTTDDSFLPEFGDDIVKEGTLHVISCEFII